VKSPLAESQRDALIAAMLPDVPFDGWSRAGLRAAARRIGMPAPEALALFSGGPAEFVACFSRWADRRMLDRLENLPADQLRAAERIARAVNIRLEIVEPWREAVRRALAILALPQHAPLGVRLLYETVDGIWYAAGDSATDFSFYTKRATLAAIYAGFCRHACVSRAPAGRCSPHRCGAPTIGDGLQSPAEPVTAAAPVALSLDHRCGMSRVT